MKRLCTRCLKNPPETVIVLSGGVIKDVCRACYDEVQDIAMLGPVQN